MTQIPVPAPDNQDAGSSVLPFLSIRDLFADDTDENWLVQDYLVPGDKTVLVARPKAGKSTLAFAWCAAILRGVPSFLGKAINGEGVGVLYCTEEVARRGIRDKARRFNLTDEDAFLVLRRTDVADQAWSDVVKKLASAAEDLQNEWDVARLLIVIDGFAKWAGFHEGQENDASVTQAALVELDRLIRDGHAVLVLHHAGWSADRERGSSGIAGEAGIRLFIEGSGTEPRKIRHLGGRHGDPCADVTYSLTSEGFETLGSMPPRMAAGLMQALGFIDELGTPTTQEVADRMPVGYRTTLQRLNRLAGMQKIERFDEGQGADHRVRWRRISPLELLFRAGSITE